MRILFDDVPLEAIECGDYVHLHTEVDILLRLENEVFLLLREQGRVVIE